MRAFTVIAAIIVIAAACGSGGDRVGTPSRAAPVLPCPTSATAGAGQPISTASIIPPDTETACRLRRAMLTLDDLPAGWARSRFVPAPGADRLTVTDKLECISLDGLASGLQTAFETGVDTGRATELREYAIVFHPGGAKRFMAAFHTLGNPASSGRPCRDETYRPLSLVRLGDDVAAFSSPGGRSGNPYDTVAIRRGDVVVWVGHAYPKRGMTTEAFARLADAKLKNWSASLQFGALPTTPTPSRPSSS